MPTYMYKAMTKNGQIVKNRITEANKVSCVRKLKRNDLIPISVRQTLRPTRENQKRPRNMRRNDAQLRQIGEERVRRNIERKQVTTIERIKTYFSDSRKITSRDIRIFTQNFYLLKKARFNNVHALSTVLEATENGRLKLIIEDILYGVEAGEYMHTTMEYYSNIFPYVYINLIKVGELSGSLDISLSQAIKYLDETEKMNTKLKRILIPNLAMFIGIIIMLFVSVIVGLPIIQNIFDQIGTKDQLPAITIWFAGVVDVLIEYWYIPVFAILGFGVGFYLWINTPPGRYRFDKFKYTMPIFGQLIYLIDFSRLLKNILLNLQNGIRIQDALEVSRNVVKNEVMLSMIDMAVKNIYVGQSWIEPFENTSFSNSMTIEMLKIGMRTDLAEMMEKLVEYMDIDIDNTLEKIMKVLPEVVTAVVGVVLIFFVLVVLVPCIQIYMGGFLFSAYGY